MANVVDEGRIRGSFKGWKRGRVFELEYARFWKQVETRYTYHYIYHPGARVIREGSRCYLEVDGMSGRVEVERTSRPEEDDNEE